MVITAIKHPWYCQGHDTSLVSLRCQIGATKCFLGYSITITGFVVLGGHTRVENPTANFKNAFKGTTSNGNGLATALVKVNFAYAGFEVSSRAQFTLQRT